MQTMWHWTTFLDAMHSVEVLDCLVCLSVTRAGHYSVDALTVMLTCFIKDMIGTEMRGREGKSG